jgi:exopolysaccharide biosynthesis polyprenyl glycosylphosphotransferase
LLFFSPLLLAIAIAVKATSQGPVVYAQERVGLDGRPFRMLKFRTMRADAEARGPKFSQDRDPRVTGVGAVLRRSSLDELPQLWNVLLGDMSLVGPRPERPVFIDQFRRRIPRYQLRHMVKSGMTGWAQIHGLRGNTSIQKRVEYDLYYIEHWSLLLDLKILARTVAFGFLSRNAY